MLFGVGPATENGFFYDFVLPRPLTPLDLNKIEKRLRTLVKRKLKFEYEEVTLSAAEDLFRGQPFKLEIIDGLMRGEIDEDGGAVESTQPQLSIYRQGSFLDLCKGPHVDRSNEINPLAIKLLSFGAVYWKGDATKAPMTRIYGTAFETKEDLEEYQWVLEEAEKRDHRKLGKRLNLFHFDATAPGMPYWLPNGMTVLNELLDFWRKEHRARGYLETATPLVNKKELWEQSGHWEHYRVNMFVIPVDENNTYGIKPMNCPNAMVIYNLKKRSYRDLPLRLSDCDPLHRHELSGALHGLMRVQLFRQDDAHIFLTEDQIGDEYRRILDICDLFYSVFGLTYKLRLGTRPKKFVGDIETWAKAEQTLVQILEEKAGDVGYEIAVGDGAFYGPKIDIVMQDCLGRDWQMGTLQLDYQLPTRFNCRYTDSQGEECTPVVVHRVVYGSLERFVGILIEHFEGRFPLWISPIQTRILTISEKYVRYGKDVATYFESRGIRIDSDFSSNRISLKVRSANLEKIPYLIIVGHEEESSKTISIRSQDGTRMDALPLSEFYNRLSAEITTKALPNISVNSEN